MATEEKEEVVRDEENMRAKCVPVALLTGEGW